MCCEGAIFFLEAFTKLNGVLILSEALLEAPNIHLLLLGSGTRMEFRFVADEIEAFHYVNYEECVFPPQTWTIGKRARCARGARSSTERVVAFTNYPK